MRLRALPLPLFLVVTACSFQVGSQTNGDQGRATFSYDACLFGCTVDQPMMDGTRESIQVHASSIPRVTVSSSDPSILGVGDATHDCCQSDGTCATVDLATVCGIGETTSFLHVNVVAQHAGTAKLELRTQDGNVFDSVSMTIASAASLSVQCDPAILAKGQSCAFVWIARDASDVELRATTGVELTTSDTGVAQFREAGGIFSPVVPSTTASQGLFGTEVVAQNAGDAIVTAQTKGASRTLAIHVTP